MATEGGDGGDGSSLPGWVFGLKPLAGVAGTLAAFAAAPREFILEEVLTFLVGGVLSGTAYLAGVVTSIWVTVGTSFVDAFEPLFGAGADIFATVAGFILDIQATLVDVLSVAGPAAPIIAMLAWAVVAILAAMILRWSIKLLPYVGQLV